MGANHQEPNQMHELNQVIEKIKYPIADKINWFDAIANSINEKLKA